MDNKEVPATVSLDSTQTRVSQVNAEASGVTVPVVPTTAPEASHDSSNPISRILGRLTKMFSVTSGPGVGPSVAQNIGSDPSFHPHPEQPQAPAGIDPKEPVLTGPSNS